MSTMTPSPGGPLKSVLKAWSETVGRTIKSVTEEEIASCYKYLVFRFEDGSGLILEYYEDEGYSGYSGDPEDINGDYSADRRARAYFGIDSLEDYTKAEEADSAKYAAQAEAQERATFERLKQKYGAS